MFKVRPIAWHERRAAAGTQSSSSSLAKSLSLVMTSLLRHKLLILTCGVLGVLGALAFSKLSLPRYEANAQLFVDPQDLRVLDKEVTPRASPSDTGVAIVESQVLVLKSNNVLRRVVDGLKLDADPEFNGARKSPLATLLAPLTEAVIGKGTSAPSPDAVTDPKLLALQALERRVWVKRTERTYIVDLTVWSESRAKAVAITDAIIKAYLQEQAAARSEPALNVGQTIDAGLEALRVKVEEAENLAAAYKRDNNLVGASGRLVTEQQLTELNSQLLTARAEMGRAKARHQEALALRDRPDSIPEALNSPTLRQIRGQLAAVLSQKARLSAQMKPQHPAMALVIEQERELRNQVRDELRRVIDSAGVEYERAKSVESALATQLEALRGQMNESNQAQIKLRELDSELEARRAVYKAAVTRASETREQARVNTTNVRVIAEPEPSPVRAFPPSGALLLPAGAIAGLGLGSFLALLLDTIGFGLGRVRRIEEDALPAVEPASAPLVRTTAPPRARAHTAAPVAAAPVPAAAPAQESQAVRDRRRRILGGARARIPVPAVEAADDAPAARAPQTHTEATPPASASAAPAPQTATAAAPAAVTPPVDRPFSLTDLRGLVADPASRYARWGTTPEQEQQRIVDMALTAIAKPNVGLGRKLSRLSAYLSEQARDGAGRPQVVIVSSDDKTPMKTVVALGLANAAFAANKRVLLVDADAEFRRLSAAMGERRLFGTDEVMTGSAKLSASITKRPDTTLEFLSVRERAPASRKVEFNAEGLNRILEQASGYDLVIIEAPNTKSEGLAHDAWDVADEVLLTMRTQQRDESLIDIMQTLRDVIPTFSGLIVTDLDNAGSAEKSNGQPNRTTASAQS